MNSLNNIGNTVLTSIHTVGWFPFAIIILVNIILYKIHPILGFLGTLFVFGWLTHLIS